MNNTIVQAFLIFILIVLAVLLILCLARAIMGPRTADRIVATNMMGTIVIVIIAILAFLLEEGYLVDICIIYAMISFLAVIVLTKVYTGNYLQRKEEAAKKMAAEKKFTGTAVTKETMSEKEMTTGKGEA